MYSEPILNKRGCCCKLQPTQRNFTSQKRFFVKITVKHSQNYRKMALPTCLFFFNYVTCSDLYTVTDAGTPGVAVRFPWLLPKKAECVSPNTIKTDF